MRKNLILLVTMMLSMAYAVAAPVTVDQAKKYGLQFAKHNMAVARQIVDADLAYTAMQGNGAPAFYVFSFEKGYVIVSADDVAQPILAFSEEGAFDAANMPDAMRSYLEQYADQITFAVNNGMQATPMIAAQWENVARNGNVSEKNDAKAVDPLLSNLKWNQDNPYNRLCPAHNYGPGGHVYAGCVATAMSMVMKYWNWPDQGVGEFSYTPEGFPTQTADFGNTTYDWANMPQELFNSSSAVQIDAVARLMWHCGVAVEMQYGYGSSGAFSFDVPPALTNYFKYSSACALSYRDSYTRTQWEDMLIASLEEGFPLYYSGSGSAGGHAFVCDGVRNDRYFHFNWGWSGYANNGYYAIDAVNPPGYPLNETNGAIFNFVPDYVYDGLVIAPQVTVVATNANSRTATITWENPTTNQAGETIEGMEKVVLERDGVVIFSQENVAAGATMSCTDEVPDFDCYTYRLHYVTNNAKGRFSETRFQYGPTCTWKLIGQTSNFQGWNGAKVQFVNANGHVFDEVTMTSSMPVSQAVRVPEGDVTIQWTAPNSTVQSLTINIKNSSNQTVYTYSGPSTGLTAGVIDTENNDCSGCLPPDNLSAEYVTENGEMGVLVSWEYADEPKNFKVYRSADNVTYEQVAEVDKTVHEYFDVVPEGSYYYKVTAYRSHCESTPAWANDGNDYVYATVTSVCENDEESLRLYPNPVNGNLNIEAAGITEVVIANVMGQIVARYACDADSLTIGTSQYEAGVYTATIHTANGRISRRFTVMH